MYVDIIIKTKILNQKYFILKIQNDIIKIIKKYIKKKVNSFDLSSLPNRFFSTCSSSIQMQSISVMSIHRNDG